MRQDIQFLRGLAVTVVILEHAGFGPEFGYLGVDIFFVISGYLITRLVQTQIAEGRFSITDFYLRRAKRLLPAAFTTFALTALAAPFFLGAIELAAFKEQLLGALTFTANFVLLSQSGYFDTEASLKPLLHIWSLSLEEQYYLILPAVLLFVRPRYWAATTVVTLIASGALCLYLVRHEPDAAFYLLPSRAWELGLGSLVALVRLDAPNVASSFLRSLFWPAVATIAILPFASTGFPHPGLDALLICLATGIIIINNRPFLGTSRPTNWLAWVGNPSYSLYLAHWPIISFAHNAHVGEVGSEVRIFLVALSFAAGLLLYYFVERPIHRSQRLPKLSSVAALSVVMVAMIAGANIIMNPAQSRSQYDFSEINLPNRGMSDECDQKRPYQRLPECQNVDQPTLLVWGDSFAMHLMQGILADPTVKVRQATRSSCPPNMRFAHFNAQSRYNVDWAQSCIEFNQDVLDSLRADQSIETVVIASTFIAFTRSKHWEAAVLLDDGTYDIRPISEELSLTVLTETIQEIRSLGKKVVIAAPPPASGKNVAKCLERQVTGLLTFDIPDCSIPIEEDAKFYGKALELLERVSEAASVKIVDPRDWLCTKDHCATSIKDTPLYRDRTHFSALGSATIGREYHIAEEFLKMAE